MALEFVKNDEWFRFYDSNGNLIERKTEVRFDPLTEESSRVIFDPGLRIVPPDFSEAASETGGVKCPFCPENLESMTPVFSSEIAEEGRIREGKAVVFPNLFPYAKHNGVVIISDAHYIRLEEFTVKMIKDAFTAATIYIRNVATADANAKYASINWNYLPFSGGSILHPHIQAIVSDSPTNYQALVAQKATAYAEKNNRDYLETLYETEKTIGERWIGECGNVAFMSAFAPKSHNDFIAILLKAHSIFDVSEQDWNDFAKGLQAIFATLTEQGFASFNLMLNIALDRNCTQPTFARLIPRLTLGKLNTSDINFFQALHGEPLTMKVPEDVAALARKHFEKVN